MMTKQQSKMEPNQMNVLEISAVAHAWGWFLWLMGEQRVLPSQGPGDVRAAGILRSFCKTRHVGPDVLAKCQCR